MLGSSFVTKIIVTIELIVVNYGTHYSGRAWGPGIPLYVSPVSVAVQRKLISQTLNLLFQLCYFLVVVGNCFLQLVRVTTFRRHYVVSFPGEGTFRYINQSLMGRKFIAISPDRFLTRIEARRGFSLSLA